MSYFTIDIGQGCSGKFAIELKQPDDTDFNLVDSDIVRFTFGVNGDLEGQPVPEFDVGSDDRLDGGSFIVFTAGTNDATIELYDEDMESIAPGMYDAMIFVHDGLSRHPNIGERRVRLAQRGRMWIKPAFYVGQGESSSDSSSSESSSSSST